MGDITPLFTVDDEGKPKEVVQSVDVGFVTAIGEGRQLSLRTFVDRDAPVQAQAEIVRNMLVLADREKAAYEIGDLRWQLQLKLKGLERAEEDVARIDGLHQKRKSEIEIEIGELRSALTERAGAHEQAFRNSGRQGVFKRSSNQNNELQAIERDIAKLQTEAMNLGATSANERRDTMTALARIKIDIQDNRDEINKRLFILGQPEEVE